MFVYFITCQICGSVNKGTLRLTRNVGQTLFQCTMSNKVLCEQESSANPRQFHNPLRISNLIYNAIPSLTKEDRNKSVIIRQTHSYVHTVTVLVLWVHKVIHLNTITISFASAVLFTFYAQDQHRFVMNGYRKIFLDSNGALIFPNFKNG